MLHLQLLVQLKEHLNKSYIKNLVLNLWKLADGSGITTQLPEYLYDRIPKGSSTYYTRNEDKIETYYCRTDLFKYSFFPYTIVRWNKLDVTVGNDKSFFIFKNFFLNIGRPNQNSIFKIHDPLGIKLLARLIVGLSHLNEHRFRHNSQDCLNPLCSCSLEVESNILALPTF